VGDEDVAQVPETYARLQDLALGPFTAVDQESVLVVFNNLR
jgi:hypothetical protein